ncbi:MAG: hypothetical protein ABR503_15685 [Chitinophagaceae bacterium]
MLALHYKLTSFTEILEKLADLFDTTLTDKTLVVPEKYGVGFCRLLDLNNELQVLIYKFRLHEDLLLQREKDTLEYYILAFEELDTMSGISFTIGSEKLNEGVGKKTAIYLTSFLYDLEFFLSKKVELSGTRILLTVPWMQQYLQLSERTNVLEKYIELKTLGIGYMPVDEEAKTLLQQLLTTESIPLLFYQSKVLRIIEKFFQWLYSEMRGLSVTSGITRKDIESAQKAEGILTNDITVLPPTLKELAKEIAISESKLKKIFKTVYGSPPYEYYQKLRMKKARMMLLLAIIL